MQALQLTAPQNFSLLQKAAPASPPAGQVLVKVRAIGICGTDVAGYLGKMPFIHYPRILGHELGVEVLQTGQGVTHLQAGDLCCVEPYLHCATQQTQRPGGSEVCPSCQAGATNRCEHLQVLGVHCDGGMCDMLTLPAQLLHRAEGLSYEQLALVEMLGIGCHAVQRAAVKSAERVLILGAGPIGLTVLEFAKIAGATVTVYELSQARRDFVAQHHPQAILCHTQPEPAAADVVFDATGHPPSMAAAFQYAAFGGRVVYVGITPQPIALDDPLFHRRELTLLASRNSVAADFQRILQLMKSGQLTTDHWISHRAQGLESLAAALPQWLQPDSRLVKAVCVLP